MFNVLASILPTAEPELSFSFSIKATIKKNIELPLDGTDDNLTSVHMHAQISNIVTRVYITCQLQNKF